MMPGPVSDSYDPEFGTGERAATVRDAVIFMRDVLTSAIGDEELLPIVEIADAMMRDRSTRPSQAVRLTKDELRVLRFSVNRALESL